MQALSKKMCGILGQLLAHKNPKFTATVRSFGAVFKVHRLGENLLHICTHGEEWVFLAKDKAPEGRMTLSNVRKTPTTWYVVEFRLLDQAPYTAIFLNEDNGVAHYSPITMLRLNQKAEGALDELTWASEKDPIVFTDNDS